MSRNMASTACECGFWFFSREPWPVDDARLKTEEALLGERGETSPYTPHGYGFAADLEGRTFYNWRTRDGTGSHCNTSAIPKEPYVVPDHVHYGYVAPEARYRFAKLTCPICHYSYVGYFRRDPRPAGREGYELYDLAFWHAWNDEPSDADRAEHREVSREDLAAAVDAWFARKT